MTLIRLVVSTLWFVGLPLILGMTWNKIKMESEPKIATTYMEGYLIWFALFYVGTFLEYRKFYRFSFHMTTKLWMLGVSGLTVLCLVILNKTFVERISIRLKNVKSFAAKHKTWLIAIFALLLFSLLFVNPLANDDVIERGNLLMKYDTIRVPSETDRDDLVSLGVELGAETELMDRLEMSGWSFPELFYMIPAGIFGVKLVSLVHIPAAIGLLFFFFSVYISIARFLYKEEKKQTVFLLIVMLFYLTMTIADTNLSVGVLSNVWNPVTLGVSCLFPVALCEAVELGLCKKQGFLRDKYKSLQTALLLVCVLIAAQLFMPYGAAFSGLAFLIVLALV